MADFSAFAQKQTLDWLLGGATGTAPAARWFGLAVGTPTFTGASEMGTLTGYSRVTALFGAAASPQGSASNTAGATFGPFSSVGSAMGLDLFDGSPVNSSNLWLYGTLQTGRTFIPGDLLFFSPGAISITLA